jgi:glutamyl/glutaminyl-tRNA synthetase
MSDSPPITRFAPSPTGYLHVGGARTALFSWLLARHAGGKFLLRIEDTDMARSTEEACTQLLEDLRWLGLLWDNQQLVFQSKRLDIYNALIAELMSRGLAYESFETNEEIAAEKKIAEAAKKSFIYRRRELPPETLAQYRASGRSSVVRFAMPVKEYRFRDEVLDKEIVFPAEEVQDFVIRKTDGMPTFHFAVVVDDAEMKVSHILRGQEHLKNTFYHIALQEALGYARPIYGHLPIIQNMDGSKMGKRDRDKKIRETAKIRIKGKLTTAQQIAEQSGIAPDRLNMWLDDSKQQLDLGEQKAVMHAVGLLEIDLPEILVHDFREKGYLPEVLLNFLALLGWSPGGDREHMSVDEMVSLFQFNAINKGNAKFARDKLLAFNTEACAAAPIERLVAAMRDYLSVNPDSPLHRADDRALAKLLHMKQGFRTLAEVDQMTRFFFVADDAVSFDREAVEKTLLKNDALGLTALREVRAVLEGVSNWTHVEIESAVKAYCEQKGLGLGKVAQPVRVAVAGGNISPPIFESLEFLGKQSTLARIDRCLATRG